MSADKKYWESIAAKILKAELAKRGLNYEDLAKKMIAIGVNEKRENINNKIGRGTYSAAFLFQSLRAIGVKNLPIEDAFFEEKEKN